VPAEDETVIAALENRQETSCALVHEISSGHYYCYLWGAPLRRFFALHKQGHILATNLHANNLAQARDQICNDNGVPEEDFNAVDLFLFLGTSGSFGSRRITVADIQVFDPAAGGHVPLTDALTADEDTARWRDLFGRLLDRQVFEIENVREKVLKM
jgi:hypothetical protein